MCCRSFLLTIVLYQHILLYAAIGFSINGDNRKMLCILLCTFTCFAQYTISTSNGWCFNLYRRYRTARKASLNTFSKTKKKKAKTFG
uniref:Hypothetical secreted protein n=1 Tax=Glossina morsitans morsitans TaxID=37546 RepID=D3TSJ0_GLOMM